MSFALDENCKVEPILGDSEEGLYILRHSCAHLLAQAVTQLYPDAKPTIGPPIEHGFYYDFAMDPIGDEELRQIEKRMKELVKQNIPIEREELDNESLRDIFSSNPFKLEIMDDKIGHDVGSSAYRQGDFIDLCKGPHVSLTPSIEVVQANQHQPGILEGGQGQGVAGQDLRNVLSFQGWSEGTREADTRGCKERPQEDREGDGALHD
ncbi:MAG: hypothetical protein Ct9H90mP24_5290 [Methanobacteriota archaeon]|nr:MAG: hypothetical protein Ct9H90mP24_5290 [Euryarchaeota archaeon]